MPVGKETWASTRLPLRKTSARTCPWGSLMYVVRYSPKTLPTSAAYFSSFWNGMIPPRPGCGHLHGSTYRIGLRRASHYPAASPPRSAGQVANWTGTVQQRQRLLYPCPLSCVRHFATLSDG